MVRLRSRVQCQYFYRLMMSKKAFVIERYYPHSTVILKEYFENITLKSCNIAKIFIKLLERFLKDGRNLAMSVPNIINRILLQY